VRLRGNTHQLDTPHTLYPITPSRTGFIAIGGDPGPVRNSDDLANLEAMEEEMLGLWGAVYLAGASSYLELVQILAEHTADQEFVCCGDNSWALAVVMIKRVTTFAGHLDKYG